MAGPFYFAYVNEGTAFNPAVHNVEDEEIYSFTLEHSEGEFPSLDLTLKNPRVGFLAPGRKQWAYLSYDKNWPGAPNIVALFYGRVLAVPQNLQEETLTLSFIARPVDYQDQKEALAATYRAAGKPYWDGIWFDDDKRDEPDNVLESRPELWHIDRVTHVVTTSHICEGEDGTLSYSDDEVFYDEIKLTYGETPLRTVRVTAKVDWDMDATDVYDISRKFEWGSPGIIYTYTGKGLVDRWPKDGKSLGNGWKVEFGQALRIDTQGPNVYYINRGLFPSSVDYPFTYRVPNSSGPLIAFPHNYEHAIKLFIPLYLKDWLTQGQERIAQILAVMRWRVQPFMIVRYEAKRKYSETLTIDLSADCQSILSDPGANDFLELNLSSSNIASPIDPGGLLPIRDVRRRTYFSSDRGAQSIEYLIALMRSRLLARARTVNIEIPVPWARAINDGLSCRKDATLTDPRLPGGVVGGKITHYRIALDGATGEASATITLGCSVGHGGTVAPSPGDPTYVQNGYVQAGYQQVENQFVMPIPGEVLYKSINGQPANDDGMDLIALDPDNVIKSLVIENTWQEQETALATDENGDMTFGTNESPNEVFKRLDPVPTRFTMVMRPVTGGPFETPFVVETSDLIIPKTIDLEAPSV